MLNAANEVAVAAFLAGRIPFPAIAAQRRRARGLRGARAARASLAGLGDVLEADALGARAAPASGSRREEAPRGHDRLRPTSSPSC